MQKLNINLKKEIDTSYEIEFGGNIPQKLSKFLSEQNVANICIITDSNVGPLYLQKFADVLEKGFQLSVVELTAGEENKNIESVLEISQKLLKNSFNRSDYIVALSGGVVGDIAGFTASIYKRGMNVIQIPTTLLSMFDSSVGGKTGVDFGEVKNILGNFKQPKRV